MRELAVQAANATVGSADKASLNQEFQALASEISRNASSTEFNGTKVLGQTTTLNFQIGYAAGTDSQIGVDTKLLNGETGVVSVLGGGNYTSYTFSGNVATASTQVFAAAGGTYTSYTFSGTSRTASATVSAAAAGTISTAAGASTMMAAIDTALDSIASLRADFGAAQNRLESTVRNNLNVIENQSAARSRVLDADFAKETANLTRTQILQQAGVAMLAQANQLPQAALSLL
jgi:flagellin